MVIVKHMVEIGDHRKYFKNVSLSSHFIPDIDGMTYILHVRPL